MAPTQSFTFLCLADNEVATHVDIQALDADGLRAHALGLLREHASAARIEVWQNDDLVLTLPRDGVRPFSSKRGPVADDGAIA
ncbi:hypothetical protein [Caulobacter sp. LjRoot300]|uniref:hypothetical protein n=1 Tax=Caulobacter sp. LjRoot300 TaxID=3342321 RepID=UPI003ECC880B